MIGALLLLSLLGCLGLLWLPHHEILEMISATVVMAPLMTVALIVIGIAR